MKSATILLYRHNGYGRWMAETDNPHVPKRIRISPVFEVGEDYNDRQYVLERVESSNPGCLVRFR